MLCSISADERASVVISSLCNQKEYRQVIEGCSLHEGELDLLYQQKHKKWENTI